MTWLFLVSVVAVFLFGFVIFFGAPFLPTLRVRTDEIFELLALKPGQKLLELGSGDGRILRAAAERGIHAVGYELNPALVIYSHLRHWRYRSLITVHWQNYWRHPLPDTDGIYVFLLDRYMVKLDTKITQEITKKVKVVSFAFAIPDKEPQKEKNGLLLYDYRPKRQQ